jgi:small RNA 2'-O-methyltransferase
MTTWLHEQRLQAVLTAVRATGARSVLDLGCGDGDLFVRLATEPGIDRLTGIDICADSLQLLKDRLARQGTGLTLVDLRRASMTENAPDLVGFDCAVLVETIEHIDPSHLTRLERVVFGQMKPRAAIINTPNAEFNRLLGVPPRRFRHPDHRFEWPRARFRDWGRRVAQTWGYGVAFGDIGGSHPELGGASQMAVFQMQADPAP